MLEVSDLLKLFLVLVLLISVPYGTYKLGRHNERTDLRQVLEQAIADAYYQGFHDGANQR